MEAVKKFIADGGLKSRKLWLTVLAMVLITVMVFFGVHYAAIIGMYPEYVGGILGALGIFCGVNVANRFTTAKHLGSQLTDTTEDAPQAKADSDVK